MSDYYSLKTKSIQPHSKPELSSKKNPVHLKKIEMLKEYLLEQGYTRTKLKLLKTNHFQIKATINNVKGVFILDTGASSSCIGFDNASTFNLTTAPSEVKAAGAGAIDMETQIAKKNTIQIGKWVKDNFTLILFDLSHVNTALQQHGASSVDGIIGADILKKGKAIIDYDKKYLYLKPL